MTDFAHTHDQVFPVRPDLAEAAHIDAAGYRAAYDEAASNPDVFWGKQAQRVEWIKAPTKIKNTDFKGDVSIKWFEDGVLNASASCLDRHLATRGDQTAIIWESDDPNVSKHITYRELHDQVCRLANAMKGLGVKQGRPRHDLPADGAGSRRRDAGLRAYRRDPLGGVRRVLAGQPVEPHPGV